MNNNSEKNTKVSNLKFTYLFNLSSFSIVNFYLVTKNGDELIYREKQIKDEILGYYGIQVTHINYYKVLRIVMNHYELIRTTHDYYKLTQPASFAIGDGQRLREQVYPCSGGVGFRSRSRLSMSPNQGFWGHAGRTS